MMTKKTDQTYHNFLTGAQVTPDDWQTKIKKGNYYEIVSENLPIIYGVILEAAREKGYFRVRAYSTWCPDGEEGILCVVEPTRILTRQEFECARTQRWKTEEQITEVDIR